MKKPMKDEYMENLAHKVADAINAVDRELYNHLMAHSEAVRANLPNFVHLAFQDRVHFLADNPLKIEV